MAVRRKQTHTEPVQRTKVIGAALPTAHIHLTGRVVVAAAQEDSVVMHLPSIKVGTVEPVFLLRLLARRYRVAVEVLAVRKLSEQAHPVEELETVEQEPRIMAVEVHRVIKLVARAVLEL